VVLLVTAPSSAGAAVAEARVQANLAVRATLAVGCDVGRRAASSKVRETVVATVRGRVAAPALERAAVPKGASAAYELVVAAARSIGRYASGA